MSDTFTIGLNVRVVSLPDLTFDAPDTVSVFQACLNRTFPIVSIENGFIELEVGEVVGESSWMHSIYLKPECLVEVLDAIPE